MKRVFIHNLIDDFAWEIDKTMGDDTWLYADDNIAYVITSCDVLKNLEGVILRTLFVLYS